MKCFLLTLSVIFILEFLSNLSPAEGFLPDNNSCDLPNDNGGSGLYRYLEDCENITNFEFRPKPSLNKDVGVHPSVCCPPYPAGFICFPSDPFCPSFQDDEIFEVDFSLDYYDQDVQLETDYYDPLVSSPKVSENVCLSNLDGHSSSTCINLKDCEGILTNDVSNVEVCGWDAAEQLLKVCCPQEERQPRENITVVPRYTQDSETPYVCDDKADYASNTGMCKVWKDNGACEIDRHFNLSRSSFEDFVTSYEMFHFMMLSCMKTCGRCLDNVCRDEHPKCRAWTRSNMCLINPQFMGHTCRESCGVCGFLSPFDRTPQYIENNTYSHIQHTQFDCGRRKSLEDTSTRENNFNRVDEYADDIFFATEASESDYNCGATIIADRWAVAAAHCYPNLGESTFHEEERTTRVKVIRDHTDSPYMEHIEVKRVYIHPDYRWPNLYSDIALVELGRRIEYDFEKFGDTPACLELADDIIGALAEVQGYGFDENGDRGRLMVAGGLRIISNAECTHILRHNITGKFGHKAKLKAALPYGLNDQLLCAQGVYDEALGGVFPGSCKGDSGGPLFLYPEKKQTLVGIVSGGIGCGNGIPGWYTKISFYARWIQCILEQSNNPHNDQEMIKNYCSQQTQEASVDNINWLD